MRERLTAFLAAGEVLGLGLPWAASLVVWLSTPGLLPASPLELAVLGFVVFRALLFLAFGRVRKMNPGKAVIMFSGDVLILPACALGYIATGDPSYGAFGKAFLGSWLSAALLVYPSVAMAGIAVAIRSRARLSSVIPGSALCFGSSIVVLASLGVGAPALGLQGVAGLALGAMRQPLTPIPGASDLATACGALLFATLAAYSVSASDAPSASLAPRLLVCVCGGAALVVWLLLAPPLSAWSVIGLPAAAIVGAIWVISRGG